MTFHPAYGVAPRSAPCERWPCADPSIHRLRRLNYLRLFPTESGSALGNLAGTFIPYQNTRWSQRRAFTLYTHESLFFVIHTLGGIT